MFRRRLTLPSPLCCWLQRNYRFFFLFVSSTTLFCIYVFSLSAVYFKVVMDNQSDPNGQTLTVWQTMGKTVVAVVLMAYTFVMVWFVGGLTIFHLSSHEHQPGEGMGVGAKSRGSDFDRQEASERGN